MNIKHKLLRIIDQPSGIVDIFHGVKPMFTNYFLTVKKFSPEINTYIDIGANKGELVKACRRVFPNCVIYAIEPIKEHCLSLKSRFPNITVFNYGLWSSNKKAKFYLQREREGVESSFLKPIEIQKEKLEEREVELKRFDSLAIEIRRPCFVKIDVEGAEDRVLEGFGDKLKNIDFIQLEQTHINKNEEDQTSLFDNQLYTTDQHLFITDE